MRWARRFLFAPFFCFRPPLCDFKILKAGFANDNLKDIVILHSEKALHPYWQNLSRNYL
jgi:hypothetical protein